MKTARQKMVVLCMSLLFALFFTGCGPAAPTAGRQTERSYMNYTGPVLPLTVQGSAAGITAVRNVEFDFSPYASADSGFRDETIVTDSYILTNETGQEKSLRLLYPFAGDMQQLHYYPTVSVNGKPVSVMLHPGPYAGSFRGAVGAEDEQTGSLNMAPPDCYDRYAALLSDDVYQAAALDAFPDLDQTAYVYRLHDYVYSRTTERVNPTLSMDFYIDYEKTHVLSYGMNGASSDPETGFCSRRKGGIEHRPNASPDSRHPADGYVILLGEDIQTYTMQGYKDGGCDPGEELDDISCTVTRYEMPLREILSQLLAQTEGTTIAQMEEALSDRMTIAQPSAQDLYLDLLAELLHTYGTMGSSPVERYATGWLEELFASVCSDDRVIYLSFEATIPAGAQLEVAATTCRPASENYTGPDKERKGNDMATCLGSNLTFTSQTASVLNGDQIEILDQNFGFNLKSGTTKVDLDMTRGNYWMKVRKRSET